MQVGQLAVEPQNAPIVLTDPVHQPPIALQIVPQAAPLHVQNPQGGVYTLEKFIKNETKVFKGTTDLEKAKAWTLNMLKSFRAMKVIGQHWVRLASCMFEDATAFQWDSAVVTNFVGREFNTITCLEFLTMFNVRYNLEQLREQRPREFSKLKQGDMTVRDYEYKFIQLDRLRPSMCSSKKARANKFIQQFALKDRVVNERPQALAQAMECACLSQEVCEHRHIGEI